MYLDRIFFFTADKCPGSTYVAGRRARHACYARSHTADASGEYTRSRRLGPHLAFEHKTQRASLDLFHARVLGGVGEDDAWSPKGVIRSGTPGNAGRSWISRTRWPAPRSKNPNELQVAGSCKDWQRAAPFLKPALLLGPRGLQQRFQVSEETSEKEVSPSIFYLLQTFCTALRETTCPTQPQILEQ